MRKIILLLIIASLAVMNIHAQLKVYDNGRVRIGKDYYELMGINLGDLRDTITALRVLGTEQMGDNARISFGGQFLKSIKTVMVGEVYSPESTNSDMLWLHGAYGFAFTQGYNANDTVLKYDSEEAEFKFKYPVKAEGLLLTSDERLKENVNHAEGALDIISELEGVTFNYAPRESPMADFVAENEYEQHYKDQFEKCYANVEARRTSQLHYGFIAQQVQQVLPELVHEDADGYLSVDYIGVIPLLVNAIQELRARLESVENGCEPIVQAVAKVPATSGVEEILSDQVAEVLSQVVLGPGFEVKPGAEFSVIPSDY